MKFVMKHKLTINLCMHIVLKINSRSYLPLFFLHTKVRIVLSKIGKVGHDESFIIS